ncbi:hypothetical protein F511_42023 [Dorcoceras hygrometricum]|uniref:Uncharacterized protein n=1 Tax=Dorcoceras hygrometricum TaxID=472368 RepID=A0A2Z7BD22_9LAMI|nr:hypothetical protein F511_42023 [Dorcoceras hygrometricum]
MDLEMLAEAHQIVVLAYLGLGRQHQLVWMLPRTSALFCSSDEDAFSLHYQFHPCSTSKSWVRSLILSDGEWKIQHGSDPEPIRLELPAEKATPAKQIVAQQPFFHTLAPICYFILTRQDSASKRSYSAKFQQQWVKVVEEIVQFSVCKSIVRSCRAYIFRSSARATSLEYLTSAITKQIDLHDASADLAESPRALSFSQKATQLKDLVHDLSLAELQSQELLAAFKSEFDQRMASLEHSFQNLCESHFEQIRKHQSQFLDSLRQGDRTKAELTSEITLTRKMLLDEVQKSTSETNSSLTSFGSQLAEIVHIVQKLVIPKAAEEKGKAAAKDEDGFERRFSV